jgi:hypothetical protein
MIQATASATQAVPSPAVANPAVADEGSETFHTVLSALNPLQYLPVVGTIYRAVTGDEVAEPVRRVGSAVTSFLMGGPIGLGLNLASLGAEKLLGINLDQIAQSVLTGGRADSGGASSGGTAVAWTPAQLSAYGVSTQPDGTLSRGELAGADVLNTLELARIGQGKAPGQTLSLAA